MTPNTSTDAQQGLSSKRELFIDRDLRIDVSEGAHDVTVTFLGASNARDPSIFLEPILVDGERRAVEKNKQMILDFRHLDGMNSSTVPPILRVLDRARRTTLRLMIRYDHLRRWQAITFSVLKAFQTIDKRIVVAPQ